MNTEFLAANLNWLAAQFHSTVALLKDLCAIPAPSRHEGQRADFIKNYLEAAGAQGVYIDEALNVVYPVGIAVADVKPVNVFLAHTDTVFPDTQPMPIREENGILYCPGVGDDTANLAVLLTVARLLAKLVADDALPDGTGILLVANSCEEGLGNLKGIRQIMKDYAGRVAQVISFDGTLDWLVNAPVGSERWEVSITTEGGHSFANFGRRNAIAELARLIDCLYKQPVPHVDAGDKSASTTTYNVGTIEGGTSVNTIAQHAAMRYEYRSDNRQCLAQMREQFNAAADVIKGSHSDGERVRVERRLLGERPCMGGVEQARQEWLAAYVGDTVAEVTGQRVEPCSGSTDCNIPLAIGVPAVCVGLYYGGGAHTREEWVELGSLRKGLEVAGRIMLQLL